ncbi:MAG: tyrosine-type recombinase/integrase [Blastocatellia bacterium]
MTTQAARGAMKQVERPHGTTERQCSYTPHSLRATTATLLLNARVHVHKVQDLLGHGR